MNNILSWFLLLVSACSSSVHIPSQCGPDTEDDEFATCLHVYASTLRVKALKESGEVKAGHIREANALDTEVCRILHCGL
jgi:hypothetical protein